MVYIINNISQLEKEIRLEVFSTHTKGIGGVIRHKIEDFEVIEITNRAEKEKGDYLIVELTKKDWDMHHAIRDLSRVLQMSQKRFGFAGTKDRRALTKQKLSIFGIKEDEIDKVNLKGITLKKIGYSNKAVYMGDLFGNRFNITIRNIDHSFEETKSYIDATYKEIKEKGLVNFFGVQRFGINRPVTHIVGKEIVKGDFESAAMTYIAKPFPGESDDAREARSYILETKDFKNGLKMMPNFLKFERSMMDYLVKNPNDYVGSFSVLQKNLKKMFVHAYQSFIFNKIVSLRFREGLPLNEATIGDIVCFKNEMGFPNVQKTQKVKPENIDGINRLIKRKRAFVTAPIVGYEVELSSGDQGDIEQKVLEKVGVNKEDFRIPLFPEFGSKGLRREIAIPTEINYVLEEDEIFLGKIKANLDFELPKGSYATVVLREFMKEL